MDPLSFLLAFFPQRLKPQILMGVLVAGVVAQVILALWKPPAPGSRWLPLYTLLNKLCLNIGWAINAYQPGKQPVMTPVGAAPEVRAAVAQKFNVPYESTKP